MQRASDIAAKPVEKREIITAGDAKRKCGGVALAFFRQKAREEWAAFPAGKRCHTLGQGDR